jgi:hypothetical protein
MLLGSQKNQPRTNFSLSYYWYFYLYENWQKCCRSTRRFINLPTTLTLNTFIYRIPACNTAATNLKAIKVKVIKIWKAIGNLFHLKAATIWTD